MIIRFYERADFAACQQIFDSNVPTFFAEEERAEFFEFLTHPPGPYLVFEEKGMIVACGGWANSRTTTNEVILCWGMVRHDRHRGGIGASLMEARLTAIFENNSSAIVSLNTSQHSANFFARFGFQTVHMQKDGYAAGIDLVEMKLTTGLFLRA